jgi:hypothetical protein
MEVKEEDPTKEKDDQQAGDLHVPRWSVESGAIHGVDGVVQKRERVDCCWKTRIKRREMFRVLYCLFQDTRGLAQVTSFVQWALSAMHFRHSVRS